MKEISKKFQKKYWEENSNTRDYKHPIVEFFVGQRLDWIAGNIDINEIESAYDVGCGDGFATYYFNKMIPNVRGGDISETMLEKNPLPKEDLDVIDAEDLPMKDNSYDLVYTWEVLHHVPNPTKAIASVFRC